MQAPIPLPYLKYPNFLPAPLPTREDIEASTTILEGNNPYHKVVLVGQHFVVKYSAYVDQERAIP